jgi:hypothetical protein
MALRIKYCFNGEPKLINFANDKYHDIYEAIAAAEGVNLKHFLEMEKQISALTRDKKAVKDYRDNEFLRFGFTDIEVIKD